MQLTETDKLKLQVIELKLTIINKNLNEFNKKISSLLQERELIGNEFKKVNDIPLETKLNVNPETGEVKIVEEQKSSQEK